MDSDAGLTSDLDADDYVDLQDYAVLADAWLEEFLWPSDDIGIASWQAKQVGKCCNVSGPMPIDLVWALLVFVGTGLAIMLSARLPGVMGKC